MSFGVGVGVGFVLALAWVLLEKMAS